LIEMQAMQTTLTLTTPAHFDYITTVDSHGWRDLAPFRYDKATKTLFRRHRLADGTPVDWQVTSTPEGLHILIESDIALSEAACAEIEQAAARVFALHWNPMPFYEALRDQEKYAWVEQGRHGRLLVSPSVWEDVAKTLLTTNTTWGQTKNMAARLCALDPDGCFPSAAQIATYDAADLAAKTGLGYRAAYLVGLAQRIVAGELDLEAWGDHSAADIIKTLKGIKGFGAYATGTILRLLNHHDALAIDTVARAAFKSLTGSEKAEDAELHAYYAPFGEWRGLALWMDCIRDEN
jgi:3-methyladenine DNA glycosylase/8-oxoguanine DNA glycosylase